MIGSLFRKARQLAGDPTLRRWLAGRAVGRYPGQPAFAAHRPAYLDGLLPLRLETPTARFSELPDRRPATPIEIPLPGETVRVEPGAEAFLFDRAFADPEAAIAVHRFAWLPILGASVDPAWVGALWSAWLERFAETDSGPAWHPYTAAERAINLLAYARSAGLPGPVDATMARLARHAPAIAERLEYFGDHHTSNHLANNGRGLFLLGLALGLPGAAEIGGRILLAEASRILLPSGILREGSSHYHLLLARAYASAWLAARAHRRPETPALEAIVARMIAVIPRLSLPGGFPLIGDVSPDCPPAFLAGLDPSAPTDSGWLAGLGADRAAILGLRDRVAPVANDALAADGWLRADRGPWSGLWHVAPAGFAAMPGHGHQDTGSFELHHESVPVFRDPGRGAYGDTGAAAHFRSAASHNAVTVDGHDPFPPNKPYYDATFRRAVAGPPPRLVRDGDTVHVEHDGFARLGRVGQASRAWHFDGRAVRIGDRLDGAGRHRICRRLHTTLTVETVGDTLVLAGGGRRFRVVPDRPARIQPTTYWSAYGVGAPATVIEIAEDATLPWTATLTIEAL